MAGKKFRASTPRGTLAYGWIHKPDTGHKYSNGKYKGTLVMNADADLSKVKAQFEEAFRDRFPNEDWDDAKKPWKSGDGHKNEEFHGKLLLDASSKFAPEVFDGKRKKLPKGLQVRSGDEVKFGIQAYAYEQTEKVREGKKTVTVTVYGVSAQLVAVQLLAKNAGGGADLFEEEEDAFDASDYEAEDFETAEDEDADDSGDF